MKRDINFAQCMTNRAKLLALAYAENRARRRVTDGSRWRNPRLLWPLTSRDV